MKFFKAGFLIQGFVLDLEGNQCMPYKIIIQVGKTYIGGELGLNELSLMMGKPVFWLSYSFKHRPACQAKQTFMRKPAFCICENKGAVTAQLISTFVFTP